MLLILLFLFFLALLNILCNHNPLDFLCNHLSHFCMHLLQMLNNILFSIFPLFLNYQHSFQLFLEFLLLNINLSKKKYKFLYRHIQLALDSQAYYALLHKRYMPIYNFVHNHLNLHFCQLKNHLRNIFQNSQNI